jgi:hypothetical protein
MIIQFKKSRQVLVFGGSCFSLFFFFFFLFFMSFLYTSCMLRGAYAFYKISYLWATYVFLFSFFN